MKHILVTGASGYIGSHLTKRLAEAGHQVDALDQYRGINDVSAYVNRFIVADIVKVKRHSFKKDYDCVVHLAGLISVEQSCEIPARYAEVNVTGTANILSMVPADHYIFASTSNAFTPVNPYAQTKLLAESLIKRHANNHSIFRFYNVAGADGFWQTGTASHLIRIAAECAAGKRSYMNLYGTDWPTKDGTCVRDYIHVADIVTGIMQAVDKPVNQDFQCLGTGIGYSCREVIDTMQRVTGKDFTVVPTDRRAGDPAITAIPPEYQTDYLQCKYTLDLMCLSAYESELSRK